MKNLAAVVVVLASSLIAYGIRYDWTVVLTEYIVVMLLGALLAAIVFPATGAFREDFRWAARQRVMRLLGGWAVVVTVLVVLSAALKTTADYSRIWFGYWSLIAALGLALLESATHALQWRKSRARGHGKRLALVGSGAPAALVERRLAEDATGDFDLVGRFGVAWSEHETLPIGRLAEQIEALGVQDVWIAAPLDEPALLEGSLAALKNALVDVHVIPDLEQYRMLNQRVSEWSGLPIINLSGIPMTPEEQALKRWMDRLGAATLLLLLLPLLVTAALLVRFSSPGPVIFRQKRHGFGGEVIEVLKFRTMRLESGSSAEFVQATPGDERTTAVGRLLRRTSLDELPQLLNVVRGEMSLVGPRPHPVELNEAFMERIPRYMLRHKVKPGITGWAQVNGLRGETETSEKMSLRIEHDLWYIQNWSLWLDVQILLRTPFAMAGRNAY